MKEISVTELKAMREQGTPHQLIDVREVLEYEMVNIKGELIPMGTIPSNLDKIRRDIPVILQCKSGGRSNDVTKYLEQQGFDNVINLKGGILAWIDQYRP
jgi:rhodanese-related sulfurtransferase